MAELTGKFQGGGARKRTSVKPYQPGQVSLAGTRLSVQMGSPSAWSAAHAGSAELANAVFGAAKTFGTIVKHQNDVEDKLSLSRAQMRYSTRLTRESLELQAKGLDGQEYVDAAAEMMKYARIDATGNANFNSNESKKEWEIIANQADTTFMISAMKFGTMAKSQRLRAETLEQLDNSAKYATALPDHDTAMELYGQIQQRIDESVESLQLSDEEGMKLKRHYGREIDYHFAKDQMRYSGESFRELLNNETAFYGKYNYLESSDIIKLREEDNDWKWKQEQRSHQRHTWSREETYSNLMKSILSGKDYSNEDLTGPQMSSLFGMEERIQTAEQQEEQLDRKAEYNSLSDLVMSPAISFQVKSEAIKSSKTLSGGQKSSLVTLLRSERAIGDKLVADAYELEIVSGDLRYGTQETGYEGRQRIINDPDLNNKQKVSLLKKMKKIPMDDPEYKAAVSWIKDSAGINSRKFQYFLPAKDSSKLNDALQTLYKKSVLGDIAPLDAARIIIQDFKTTPTGPQLTPLQKAQEAQKKRKEQQ